MAAYHAPEIKLYEKIKCVIIMDTNSIVSLIRLYLMLFPLLKLFRIIGKFKIQWRGYLLNHFPLFADIGKLAQAKYLPQTDV